MLQTAIQLGYGRVMHQVDMLMLPVLQTNLYAVIVSVMLERVRHVLPVLLTVVYVLHECVLCLLVPMKHSQPMIQQPDVILERI